MCRSSAITRTRCAFRRSGFTLPELVTVLVLLAIVSAAAAPSLSSLGASRRRVAARLLLNDMSLARERALATGATHWVAFTTSGSGSWTLLSESPANPGRANAVALTDLATGRTHSTTLGSGEYAGVSITSCSFAGGNEVGFDWLGRPVVSSGIMTSQGSVTLSAADAITVQGRTGLIQHVP